MPVKKLRPITPGQRFRVAPVFDDITKQQPEKALVKGKTQSGGRNEVIKENIE
jgi:large subunit ribosomal protein L2